MNKIFVDCKNYYEDREPASIPQVCSMCVCLRTHNEAGRNIYKCGAWDPAHRRVTYNQAKGNAWKPKWCPLCPTYRSKDSI